MMILKWLQVLVSSGKSATAPRPTEPLAVKKAKATVLLRRYASSVGLFLYLLSRFPGAPGLLSLRSLSLGVLWLFALGCQGLHSVTALSRAGWRFPGSDATSLEGLLRWAFCYVLAFGALVLTAAAVRIDVASVVLGGFWWLVYAERGLVEKFLRLHVGMGGDSVLWAISSHGQTMWSWIQHSGREWFAFGACLVGIAFFFPDVLFPGYPSAFLTLLQMIAMTLLWTSGCVSFQEALTQRYDYGPETHKAALQKLHPSLNSSDPVIKVAGLCHVKWILKRREAIGSEYAAEMFEAGESGIVHWSVCATECCNEIRGLKTALVAVMGRDPEQSMLHLKTAGSSVYRAARKLQHKYVLLRLSLECLVGMLLAAKELDSTGRARFGRPSIGEAMTHIYEAQVYLSHFATCAQGMLTSWWTPWLPFLEIWCLSPLDLQFEMAAMAVRNAYGNDIFLHLGSPEYMTGAVLKRHVHFLTERK